MMNRKGKIDFCLEGAEEFEGLDMDEYNSYLIELNEMTDEELDYQVEKWEYLWEK